MADVEQPGLVMAGATFLAQQQIAAGDVELQPVSQHRLDQVLDAAVIAEIDKHHRVALRDVGGGEMCDQPIGEVARAREDLVRIMWRKHLAAERR